VRTKPELITFIADHWDPVSVTEREHVEKSLSRFKQKTLQKMAADIEARKEAAKQNTWCGWLRSLFNR
jgi:hypothetical protein